MQYKESRYPKPLKELFKTLFFLLFFFPLASFSQTTFLPQGAKENILLERLEIKAGTDSILNFSKTKPYSRKQFIPVIERYGRASGLFANGTDSVALIEERPAVSKFSKVDRFNIERALMNSSEWTTEKFSSKKMFLKKFYKTPSNFYEVAAKDFFLAVNPVFQYLVGKEKGRSEHLFLNTRGITLRGNIANKIGFAVYVTDNQERDPEYVRQWVSDRQAVPGQGFFKEFKGSGYDYFDARGYISFNAAKYIDIIFGYDKNFIGNGQRSLFLSDFSNNVLFLKLNTRIWKINYQTLFMELVNAYQRGADQLLGKKYAAMHHLDVSVTKWLNVGLFEGIVFGRPDHFEFGYLNPVMFYRSAEQQNGSPDNAVAGLDIKANIAKRFQVYGQVLLDELKLSEVRRKWWGNKFGYQLGAKYIDAFGIANLDVQAEWNRVRPFTYSHDDSLANYTHYNQPLAHPIGANFNEVIGVVRYQPVPKLLVQGKLIYYKQGRDSSAANYGSNIFLPNAVRRPFDYGFEVGEGALSKIGYGSLLLSYELKPNFFIEANAVYHRQNAVNNVPERNSVIMYAGIRWNMHRRDFEF
ncbi:MAG TPA: capsule assembly Wzi family protein [Flavisolibacter sp.]|nr:capsule assembly Wzi family protein [Flavisolibacter sp.]